MSYEDITLINSISSSSLISKEIKFKLFEDLFLNNPDLLSKSNLTQLENEAKIYFYKNFFKMVNKLIKSIENDINFLTHKNIQHLEDNIYKKYQILDKICSSNKVNYIYFDKYNQSRSLIYKIIDHYYDRNINYIKTCKKDDALQSLEKIVKNPNTIKSIELLEYIKKRISEYSQIDFNDLENVEEQWLLYPYLTLKSIFL
jgi:hypothetical protein